MLHLNPAIHCIHVDYYNVSLPASLRAAQCAGISVTQGPILRCNDKSIGRGPQKLKFLLRFDQNVEYKRPAGAYPLRDFHKICRVCTTFQDALAVRIRWICSRHCGIMGYLS